jgi:hypothetical protein
MLRLIRTARLWILAAPYALMLLGAASNQLVLNANGDTFPVRINPVKVQLSATHAEPDGTVYLDPTHVVMSSKTRLNPLADVLDFKDGIYSVGDELLLAGDWLAPFCWLAWALLMVLKNQQVPR